MSRVVPVSSLTRGCQYTDEKWHICARLSYEYLVMWNGLETFKSFRCREHGGVISFGQDFEDLDEWHYEWIHLDETFGLGYKP